MGRRRVIQGVRSWISQASSHPRNPVPASVSPVEQNGQLVSSRFFRSWQAQNVQGGEPVKQLKQRNVVTWSFATAGLGFTTLAGSTAALTVGSATEAPPAPAEEASGSGLSTALPNLTLSDKPVVVFVLGGPGSGKGTQCANIVRDYGFVHLSAGDLLRAEVKSGSEHGVMIQNMMDEGKIVPSEVTIDLLEKAMKGNIKGRFLIDGFPRNEENRAAFERQTGITPDFILFFNCPEDVMEQRLLGRGQGRADDNIATIKKRFNTFIKDSVPVVDYYDVLGKVRKVEATKPIPDVYEDIRPLFNSYLQD